MAKNQSPLGYGALLVAGVALVVAAASAPAADTIDAVVAVVEGTPVLASELVALRTSLLRQGESVTAPAELLERKIEDLLIAKRSESLNLAVGEKEVDDAIQRIADENRLTKEELFRALSEQGLTPGEYRELLGQQILRMRIIQHEVEPMVRVDRADLVAHMKANPDRFAEPPRIQLRLLSPQNGAEWLQVCGNGCRSVPAKLAADLDAQEPMLVDWYALDEQIRFWLSSAPAESEVRAFSRGDAVVVVQFVTTIPGRLKPLDEVYDVVYDEVRRRKLERAFQQWLADLKADAWIERFSNPLLN